jgi:hypothetical protein
VVVLNKKTGTEYAFVCEGWVEAAGGAGRGASVLLEARTSEAMARAAKDTYRVQVMTGNPLNPNSKTLNLEPYNLNSTT